MIAAAPTYHEWPLRRGLKRIVDKWIRIRPLRRADVVFALSRHTRDELVSLFGVDPARVVVAYWGVSEQFNAVARRVQRGQSLHLLRLAGATWSSEPSSVT